VSTEVSGLLNADDFALRVEAVKTIALLGDKSAVPELEKMLNDDEWPVRYYTLRALARLIPEDLPKWRKLSAVDSAVKIQHLGFAMGREK
jgi:HEAT repeat protein